MKTSHLSVLAAIICVGIAGCGKSDNASVGGGPNSSGGATPIRQTSFGEVTSQLDPGGNVYAYLATDQWLAGLSTNVTQLREALLGMPGISSKDRTGIDQVFGLLGDGIARSGLEDLTGVGLSGVQISPALYRTKLILHHQRGHGDGLLWKVMGQKPHELEGMDLLTTQTALAAFGDVDLSAVWETVERGLTKSGVPDLANGIKQWPAEFEKQTQVAWKDFLASLGGELGLVLTLDDANMIDIPFVEGMQIPEPGLLLAVKVKNNLLYDHVSSQLKKSTMVQLTDEKGLKMCAMPIPLPLPVQLEITVASTGDYFFLATASKLVRNALAVRAGKQPGLRQSPEFAALLKYLPAQGNQFIYADKKFSGTLLELRRQALRSGKLKSDQVQLLQKLFTRQTPTFGLSIGSHTSTGWQTVSVGNQDSAPALLGAAAIVPIGALAAIAVPNFVKARETAQRNACIRNLQQLDAAKLQWSLEYNKNQHAVPNRNELTAYLKNRAWPVCPKGGNYTIGEVGEPVICSEPGHVLPSQ